MIDHTASQPLPVDNPLEGPYGSAVSLPAEEAGPRLEWLVDRILPVGTHGVIAGPVASLNSRLAKRLAFASFPGRFLDEFVVPRPTSVLCVVGLGGADPEVRVSWRSPVDLDDFGSIRLRGLHESRLGPGDIAKELRSFLEEEEDDKPDIVIVSYHAAADDADHFWVDGFDHDQGPLLSAASSVCMEFNSALLMASRYNSTGYDVDPSQIANLVEAEWSASWIAFDPLFPPTPVPAPFTLSVHASSRHGGKIRRDVQLGTYEPPPPPTPYGSTWGWEFRSERGPEAGR